MIYCSLGSQPVVSSVLKDCALNTNSMLLDNVGDYSFETLTKNLKNNFKNFFSTRKTNKNLWWGGEYNKWNSVYDCKRRTKRNIVL